MAEEASVASRLVEIAALDPHDDDALAAAYAVHRRAELHGREDAPFWSPREYAAGLRVVSQRERRDAYVGTVDGRVVAVGVAFLSLLDNVDKAWLHVSVDPAHRRRGRGRALLAHLEHAVGVDGRRELIGDLKVPIDLAATHPYRRFAEACGYAYSNTEVVRYLALPVAEQRIKQWIEQAAEKHSGYPIETYVDGVRDVPDELVPSLCRLFSQLAVDAPTGEVDWEEEAMSPELFAERTEEVRALGRALFETVAVSPAGEAVAQTTLTVPLDTTPDVWQWGTFVHREHRGHRLGLAVKARNLLEMQRAHPDKRRVVTQNAETNDYMVAINELMGFEPVEASVELVKRVARTDTA